MEINYREFIRNFGKYKRGYEEVRVMGKRGVVGIWRPADLADQETGEIIEEGEVRGVALLGDIKETFVKNAAYERISGMFEEDVEGEKCFKCGSLAAGKFEEYDFETGEDRCEWICMKCAKRGGIKIKT